MEEVKKENENLEPEQTMTNKSIDNSGNNFQEEIKKINERIDNVLMQLTINNSDKTLKDVEEEKDEELDF